MTTEMEMIERDTTTVQLNMVESMADSIWKILSFHLNGHFPGEPGLAGVN